MWFRYIQHRIPKRFYVYSSLSASIFRAVITKLLTSFRPCFKTVRHARFFSLSALKNKSLNTLKQPFKVVRIG